MPVRELTTDEEWDRAIPVLRELWTDASSASVRSWREDSEYHLLGLFVDGVLVGVAGVSVQRVMHHVRHAWIHDFVVRERRQGEGHGSALLSGVESWAEERDCEYVALAVRDGNDAAEAFYESNGLTAWGTVYEREL